MIEGGYGGGGGGGGGGDGGDGDVGDGGGDWGGQVGVALDGKRTDTGACLERAPCAA